MLKKYKDSFIHGLYKLSINKVGTRQVEKTGKIEVGTVHMKCDLLLIHNLKSKNTELASSKRREGLLPF